eukprot:m.47746 g.47746  ORF g.47746 m.47746 type:complete len:51 (+) comp47616_c0_seq7:8-160(+)
MAIIFKPNHKQPTNKQDLYYDFRNETKGRPDSEPNHHAGEQDSPTEAQRI